MNAWLEMAKMNYNRGKHAIGVINGSLWITGGEDNTKFWEMSPVSYSSEYLDSNGFIKSGSDLPYLQKRHIFFFKIGSNV